MLHSLQQLQVNLGIRGDIDLFHGVLNMVHQHNSHLEIKKVLRIEENLQHAP